MQENLEGFKYDFPCQQVLMMVSGSGIAPIRAAIESGQLNISKPGEGGRTARLYYGVTTVRVLMSLIVDHSIMYHVASQISFTYAVSL